MQKIRILSLKVFKWIFIRSDKKQLTINLFSQGFRQV